MLVFSAAHIARGPPLIPTQSLPATAPPPLPPLSSRRTPPLPPNSAPPRPPPPPLFSFALSPLPEAHPPPTTLHPPQPRRLYSGASGEIAPPVSAHGLREHPSTDLPHARIRTHANYYTTAILLLAHPCARASIRTHAGTRAGARAHAGTYAQTARAVLTRLRPAENPGAPRDGGSRGRRRRHRRRNRRRRRHRRRCQLARLPRGARCPGLRASIPTATAARTRV